MKWIGITGTWKNVNALVERDVRAAARKVMARGDGIVAGGAPGVDFFATHEALLCDPTARAIRLVLPATLEIYAQQYRERVRAGKLNAALADQLIDLLMAVKKLHPSGVIEMEARVLSPDAFFARNAKLVEVSDELLAFRIQHSPGTTNTIEHARATGKRVVVADYD